MIPARFVLGIDTAGRFGSIALAENGSAFAWETLPPGEHSSGISRAGERLLRARGLAWSDLAGVAVSIGPGSFTGLRIGLAWAKGVCFGSRAKLALVTAHEANAYRHRRERGLVATVLQGERGEAQCALWSGGEGIALLWGPESVPERELAERLGTVAREHACSRPESPGSAAAGPDLSPAVRAALAAAGLTVLEESGGEPATSSGATASLPTAAAVAELGDQKLLAGEAADLMSSAPAYGRAPNARKPSP